MWIPGQIPFKFPTKCKIQTGGALPASPVFFLSAMKRLTALSLALLSLISCRSIVLEERDGCPSFLFFDVGNKDDFGGFESVCVGLFRYPDGAPMESDTTSLQAICDRSFYMDVRRTNAVEGFGLLGFSGSLKQGGNVLTAALGEQFDPVFRFSYMARVEPESFIVPVEFAKEHAKVTVQFTGMETFMGAGGRFPFDIVVKTNTAGLDALTGLPVRGEFQYKPSEEKQGLFRFCLPRLADRNLVLELYGRPGISERVGHLDSFDLWAILEENGGISWEEKDLPDIYIEIDYRETSVSVRIDPWDNSHIQYEF